MRLVLLLTIGWSKGARSGLFETLSQSQTQWQRTHKGWWWVLASRRARLREAACGLKKDQSRGTDCSITMPFLVALTTGSTKRHALEACRTKSASRARGRPPPLRPNVCIQFSSSFFLPNPLDCSKTE